MQRACREDNVCRKCVTEVCSKSKYSPRHGDLVAYPNLKSVKREPLILFVGQKITYHFQRQDALLVVFSPLCTNELKVCFHVVVTENYLEIIGIAYSSLKSDTTSRIKSQNKIEKLKN